MPLASTCPAPRRFLVAVSFVVFVLVSAPPCRAGTWVENGDAGDLPASAQSTFGSGALTVITGSLFSDADVDMFCVTITDEPNFTAAYTPCSSNADPDMWLFASNGLGVTHADFCQGGIVGLTSQFVTSPGIYYVAISGTDGDALRSGVTIWLSTNAILAERAPDGPGAPGPVTSWGGNRVASRRDYTIQLTGAQFCDFPVPLTPSTWGEVKSRYE
jgi:hypothetical protein